MPSLMLPTLAPAVTDVRRVPPVPEDVRHANDVSDDHSLPSHPDAPVLALAEEADAPRPDPLTVTLELPVPAALLPVTAEIDPTS